MDADKSKTLSHKNTENTEERRKRESNHESRLFGTAKHARRIHNSELTEGHPSSFSKKASELLAFFAWNVARPEGFEPPTPWFVAKYSIQMSYGREMRAKL